MAPAGVTVHGVRFGNAPVTIPAAQMRQLLGPGDVIVNADNETGVRAGIVFNEDGSLDVERNGTYTIVCMSQGVGGKSTLRTAQYICGLVGIAIVNFVLFYDHAERGANAKDFLINFSSDILAVGAVLFIAEIVDRAKGGSRETRGRILYDTPIAGSSGIPA
eukprot:CAMPEP_0174826976 /NCGR_PEP_ID=MMETSP1114-20130205/372_1 /TAXON_ID=312471 /ORGANISM="Neobodo designis, Strain CCAP 1951/1" /LENGTH=161 /DNA_ID=CAMNT_0016060555 /DNA_START=45 /DNA_END=530 /DNA_ORIENTATION=+